MLKSKRTSDQRLLSFISSIVDLDIQRGPWVAGGCARRLWNNEPWDKKDIDIFFPTQDSFNETCAILEKITKKEESVYLDGMEVHLKAKTSNAKTYSVIADGNNYILQPIKKSFYRNITELFNDFDLTVCKFATDGKVIVADEDAIMHCEEKRLVYNRQDLPSKINPKRIIKYNLYGFKADPAVMLELIRQYHSGEIHSAEDADYA